MRVAVARSMIDYRFDSSSMAFCAMVNCVSSEVKCHDVGATPPATLTEFTLDSTGGMDFYDASLVDGYDLPLLIQMTASDYPNSSSLTDLNNCGPDELHADAGHTYRNAYEAFKSPMSYYNGAYDNLDTCHLSSGPPA
jgi:hypothetical protein